MIQYQVESQKDLISVIKHFDSFPLITQKQADYFLFKQAFNLILKKKHLTLDGINKIVAIKASSNLGLSEKLKAAFPNIMPITVARDLDCSIKDPHWLAGFTSAEGCFHIALFKSSGHNLKERVKLIFQLTQHIRDRQLLILLETYFGCGKYFLSNDHRHGDYIVSDVSALAEKIIPFFSQYKIIGIKEQDYLS